MITELSFTELVKKLDSCSIKRIDELSGHFTTFEFDESNFKSVYDLLDDCLGDRDYYNNKRLETGWEFSTDKSRQIKALLYDDSLSFYIDIPSVLKTRSDFNSLEFDFTESEIQEYLKKEEINLRKLEALSSKVEEDKERLLQARLKRNKIEKEYETKWNKKLEDELDTLNSQKEKELAEIAKLEAKISLEEKLEKERKALKALANKKASLENRKRNVAKRHAKKTLPAGYDYNLPFYRSELFKLRKQYGTDNEIDNAIKKWDETNFGNGWEAKRAYAKQYVEYYKVKYEKVSILKDYNNPEPINTSFSNYLQNIKKSEWSHQKNEAFGFFLVALGIIGIYALMAFIM